MIELFELRCHNSGIFVEFIDLRLSSVEIYSLATISDVNKCISKGRSSSKFCFVSEADRCAMALLMLLSRPRICCEMLACEMWMSPSS